MRDLYHRFMLRQKLGEVKDELRNPPTKDAQEILDAARGGLESVKELLTKRYAEVREAAYNSVALLLPEYEATLGDAPTTRASFESALLKLQDRNRKTKAKGFGKCKYDSCPQPYFFRTPRRRDFCGDTCYDSHRNQSKRETWHKNKEKYRPKEK